MALSAGDAPGETSPEVVTRAQDIHHFRHGEPAVEWTLLCFVLAVTVGGKAGLFIAGGVGLVMVLIAPCFHHLTVEDQSDRLAIRFGPVPLFGRTVKYADIERTVVGRTTILDGWGIHYSIRGGWAWNLWGRDCVDVRFKNRGVMRIGTDDAEVLAGFLTKRIAPY